MSLPGAFPPDEAPAEGLVGAGLGFLDRALSKGALGDERALVGARARPLRLRDRFYRRRRRLLYNFLVVLGRDEV